VEKCFPLTKIYATLIGCAFGGSHLPRCTFAFSGRKKPADPKRPARNCARPSISEMSSKEAKLAIYDTATFFYVSAYTRRLMISSRMLELHLPLRAILNANLHT
jgi:hypothetical protein